MGEIAEAKQNKTKHVTHAQSEGLRCQPKYSHSSQPWVEQRDQWGPLLRDSDRGWLQGTSALSVRRDV